MIVLLSNTFVYAEPGSEAAPVVPNSVLHVPTSVITTGPGHHWFGYYDKLEFDPSGRFVLSNEVDFEGRSPKPDDMIKVGMIDLEDDKKEGLVRIGEDVVESAHYTRAEVYVLRKVFPTARLARVDTDTMSRKGALRETLNAFKAAKLDMLVGTQMIAKGLHFPNVTLVGILNADIGLHIPDFRAGERTFQLLTQVAGRAGRGEMEGEVVIQTFTPHSPSIQFARHHDFGGFVEQEIEFRKGFSYPPFFHCVLITTRSEHARRAEFSLQTIHRRLSTEMPEDVLLGEPVESPLQKAAGQFRYQLMLRAPTARRITRPLQAVLAKLPVPEDVHVAIDVDPLHLS